MRRRGVLTATFASAVIAACGARTGLLAPGDGTAGGAFSDAGNDRSARSRDGTGDAPRDTPGLDRQSDGLVTEAGTDPCPSNVLAGSPLPMFGNCSTRDGRSRVVGPKAPHVSWTERLPNFAGTATPLPIVADTSGSVYISSSLAQSAWILRLDGASSGIAWSTLFNSSAVDSPYILGNGTLEAFGSSATGLLLVDAFAAASGAVTRAPLGAPFDGVGPPAIGSDGSLYVAYTQQVAAEDGALFVIAVMSRIAPNRTVAWTTPPLGSVGKAGGVAGLSIPAIDLEGTVIVSIQNGGNPSAVIALDPNTGTTLWSSEIVGDPTNNPAVLPDGSIAVESSVAGAGRLTILEPTGVIRTAIDTPDDSFVRAISRTGIIILGDVDLEAVDGAGKVLWSQAEKHVDTATIDADGTLIITYGDRIEALELTTGSLVWRVSAPPEVPCIASASLTSQGGMVAVGCVDINTMDGLVYAFGISD